MTKELKELAKAAADKIEAGSSLADIESAVGIAKSVADAEKITAEHTNLGAQNRLEWLKALPALIVPIVSLATVIATIWIQKQQFEAARQQDEDKQWREFLTDTRKSMKESPAQVISDPTFAPQLRSFLHSNVYKTQALDLGKIMLGKIANKDDFDYMLNIVLRDYEIRIADFSDINKQVNRNISASVSVCKSLSKKITKMPTTSSAMICDANTINEQNLQQLLAGLEDKTSTDIVRIRQEYVALSGEQQLISRLIASKLRAILGSDNNKSLSNIGAAKIDLSGVDIEYADFSGVDFRKVDMSNMILDQVKLNDAILIPLNASRPQWIAGSNWWDAKEIEYNFLTYLIEYNYPGFTDGEAIIGDRPITYDYYKQNVARLCAIVNKQCEIATLKFEDHTFTTVPFPN